MRGAYLPQPAVDGTFRFSIMKNNKLLLRSCRDDVRSIVAKPRVVGVGTRSQ